MKIVVIGGTGMIGSQVVTKLTAAGHDASAASLATGVDLISGEGLGHALEGAEVVVNVTNSPTFDDASLDFFRRSMNNLMTAGRLAEVRHQVILSIVGVDGVPQLAYYRAKSLQEEILRAGTTPYSIVRATQFFEFMESVVSWTSDAHIVRLPATRIQPIAAADVADAVSQTAVGAPLQGVRNIAGPEVFALDALGKITLGARNDERYVITDDQAGMFAGIDGDILIAGADAQLFHTRYEEWLANHSD